MSERPEPGNESARDGLRTSPDARYRATVEALDEAVNRLAVGLRAARLASPSDRPRVLNDLHQRVRGMGLLLNEALSEYAASATPDGPE